MLTFFSKDKKNLLFFFLGLGLYFFLFILTKSNLTNQKKENYFNLKPRNINNSRWIGNKVIDKSVSILILAGHADSQGIDGAGTSGEAVSKKGLQPMNRKITDELFWNIHISKAIVKLGKTKGLDISFYDPKIRTIIDPNDKATNWSVGANYASKGVYVLEIHFDSYGNHGIGSGLIPPISQNLNYIDESLANAFGKYPLFFRGGLGAPRRQIRILEIAKLEGDLERNLRNIYTRKQTIHEISMKVIDSILIGLNNKNAFSLQPEKDYIFLPNPYH